MTKFILAIALFFPFLSSAQFVYLPSWDRTIRFIAYSPDGNQVIANSSETTAGVWDMSNGKILHTLKHEHPVRDAIFDPSGKYILTKSSRHTTLYTSSLILWNAETGDLLHHLEGHTKIVTDMEFNSKGDKIITASEDGTARLWSAGTGELIQTFADREGRVNCVKFSSSGKTIATTSTDKTAKIRLADTGELQHTLHGHTDNVTYATYSPDGKRLFTASNDETVKVWNVETGEELQTLSGHPADVKHIAFSPDQKYLLTTATGIAEVNNTIMLWDVSSLDLVHKIEGNILDKEAIGHRERINDALFNHNSELLICSDYDGEIKVWDTESGDLMNTSNWGMGSFYLAVHPSKNIFLVGGHNNFKVIQAESGKRLIELYLVDDHPDQWIHTFNGKKYVDTRADVMKKLQVMDQGKVHPFSAYENDFYVPDLWVKVMKGDTLFVKE
ncbi:MAG: WD40 repeat domain-containing protein [Cryomorphaceae bacterium]